MLKYSGNLEETCICISSMIMTQLSIFSVSEKGKTSSQGGGMRPPPLAANVFECHLPLETKIMMTRCSSESS